MDGCERRTSARGRQSRRDLGVETVAGRNSGMPAISSQTSQAQISDLTCRQQFPIKKNQTAASGTGGWSFTIRNSMPSLGNLKNGICLRLRTNLSTTTGCRLIPAALGRGAGELFGVRSMIQWSLITGEIDAVGKRRRDNRHGSETDPTWRSTELLTPQPTFSSRGLEDSFLLNFVLGGWSPNLPWFIL